MTAAAAPARAGEAVGARWVREHTGLGRRVCGGATFLGGAAHRGVKQMESLSLEVEVGAVEARG